MSHPEVLSAPPATTDRIDRRTFLVTAGAAAVTLATTDLLAATPGAVAAGLPAPRLRPLPYAHAALEPWLDRETIRVHHEEVCGGHAQALASLLRHRPRLAALEPEALLRADLRELGATAAEAARRHAQALASHTLYFEGLAPFARAQKEPTGALAAAVRAFPGGLGGLRSRFVEAALGVAGSGWVYVTADVAGRVAIATTCDEEPLADPGATPLVALDLWEHAYYLRHREERLRYVLGAHGHIDWRVAEARYARRSS